MEEVEELVRAAVGPEREVPASLSLSYREAFMEHAGPDPVEADTAALRDAARRQGVADVAGLADSDRDGWLDHLLTRCVVPAFERDRPVFLHSWPASQAALARLEPSDPGVARRFELYWHGIELANGYHELGDAGEQEARFEADQAHRRRAGLPVNPVDHRLLEALAAGLPDCAGVALGFDRLVMLAAGVDDLDSILAFPPERA